MKHPTPLNKAYVKAMALKGAVPFPCEIAGSIRREAKEVGDLDLVVIVPELVAHINWARTILECDLAAAVTSGGPRRASGTVDGYVVNLWCGLPEEAGALLMYATGPSGYNIYYRKRAKGMGLKLNEKGLFDAHGARIAGADECSIYTALGRPWKEPCVRGYKPPPSQRKGVVHE